MQARMAFSFTLLCLTAGMVPAQSLPSGLPSPLMKALDLNGDGTLSADEIKKASATLAGLDTNRDGKVTPDELKPMPKAFDPTKQASKTKPLPPAEEAAANRMWEMLARRFDSDKDGKIKFKDIKPTNTAIQFLDRMDFNKDQILEKADIRMYYLNRSKARVAPNRPQPRIPQFPRPKGRGR